MRKIKKLLTYQQCIELLKKQTYETLAFYTDIPCILPINYISRTLCLLPFRPNRL